LALSGGVPGIVDALCDRALLAQSTSQGAPGDARSLVRLLLDVGVLIALEGEGAAAAPCGYFASVCSRRSWNGT